MTYILWSSIFYTSINIPYGSMASAISASPSDRQSLSTFRSIGSTMAGVLVGAGVPLFAYATGDDGQVYLHGGRFTLIAGIFSILSVIAYLVCYFLTTERVKFNDTPAQHKKNTLKKMLLSAVNNPTAQSVATLVMMGAIILTAFFAKPLSNKFGKAEISAVASLFAAAVSLLTFFIHPKNVWVYVALQSIIWLGLGLFTMVTWAMITDVIDDSEVRNEIREDGAIYAMYSFSRKLGQAAAAGLSGGLLSLVGYTEGAQNAPPVLRGIFNISTIVPAVSFFVLALILWLWYPLHKKRVLENTKFLREKHGRTE